ncbi:uncharacterized protein LOC142979973 [Anticarsia gemmatalis]|uniref:uncharacterized protein LOC142979973 n=1 Tax=Anticarsia gemmatalis TaxID=129554 RepID=UPI003F75E3BB
MYKSKCTHIRKRDTNNYNIDVEELIKSIEKEFDIDFRSLPRWEDLVKRLHVSKTDYKRKVQQANLQKTAIIDKLYTQSTRPSPFQLTEELARTAAIWRQAEADRRKPKVSLVSEPVVETISDVIDEEIGEELDTPHPNTEIPSTSEFVCVSEPSKIDAEIQCTSVQDKPISSLPVMIQTNTHKLLSALSLRTKQLSYHSVQEPLVHSEYTDLKQHEMFTSAVICNPSKIIIEQNILEKQFLLFSLTNSSGDYLHIRFKHVTDLEPFTLTKLLPVIPKRLYPGIPVVYKFIFKLQKKGAFQSGLLFNIGRDVYDNAPTSPFLVPIISTFGLHRSVAVSDIITIPPLYPWLIKNNPQSEYPTGTLKISVNDPYSYHLHIRKRELSLPGDSDVASMKAAPPSETSLADQSFGENKSALAQSHNILEAAPSKNDETLTNDFISLVLYDIVQLALEAFVLEYNYLFLKPFSERKIPIYFTKAEQVGNHQSYFDLELIDSKTEILMMTKSVRVFADILPHPIQITPLILDMSEPPLTHGYFEDQFVITNTHNLYPITVYINLTTKIKRLITVTPMKCLLATRSSVPFIVRFCSKAFLAPKSSDDLVHFTIKVSSIGYKKVFGSIPPIYYEIIVPCVSDFKKVYKKQYLSLLSADKHVPST